MANGIIFYDIEVPRLVQDIDTHKQNLRIRTPIKRKEKHDRLFLEKRKKPIMKIRWLIL